MYRHVEHFGATEGGQVVDESDLELTARVEPLAVPRVVVGHDDVLGVGLVKGLDLTEPDQHMREDRERADDAEYTPARRKGVRQQDITKTPPAAIKKEAKSPDK